MPGSYNSRSMSYGDNTKLEQNIIQNDSIQSLIPCLYMEPTPTP
jgi:hypothetical protein